MPLSTYTPKATGGDLISQWGNVGGASHGDAVRLADGDAKRLEARYDQIITDVWQGTWDIPPPDEGGILSLFQVPTFTMQGLVTNGNGPGGDTTHVMIRLNGVDYIHPSAETWTVQSYSFKTRTWLSPNPATGSAWKASDLAAVQGIGIFKDTSVFQLGRIRLTQMFMRLSWTAETKRALRGTMVAKVIGGKVVKVGPDRRIYVVED